MAFRTSGAALFMAAIAVLHAPQAVAVTCPAQGALTGEFAPNGIDTSTISRTIRPGDDFFGYLNQGWIDRTPIPEGYWDYGQTNVLMATVDARIRGLVTAGEGGAPGSPARQVQDAYAAFRDTAAIDRRGLEPFRAGLDAIMRAGTAEDVARRMADPSSSTLFAINVFPAEGRWLVHLDQQNQSQPMLGLPNREAYEQSDAASAANRAAYEAHIATLLAAAGMADAKARAARVVALEARIAANQWDFARLRDRKANYHPMTVAELTRYAPGFPWRAYLQARGVGHVTDIVLGTDTAVQTQARLFAATPLDDWRAYLAFHWLRNQADVLPQALRDSNWAFYGQTLSNAKAPPPRAEVALRLVNGAMGHLVGRLYAERHVTPETRAAATEMVAYLRKAFDERLSQAAWMDEPTRAEARAKLAAMTLKVGYPKVWRDYSGVAIQSDDAAGNLRRLRQSDWDIQRQRLKPGAAGELWYQTPQTVDASYSVLMNAIELPAGYLQPPYFDAAADPAVNFGAIGAIIGHEMGHGFDDQGIIYDSRGRLRGWWSDAALKTFHDRAQALVDQYDAFSPYAGVHVNGRQTIGETIADLSGVSLSYRAWQMYMADHPCADTSRDGLRGDQRFFLAWAQAWRYAAPESAIRHVIKYSYHAPTPYRVNGVVRNLDAWYAAFGVKPGDALYLPPEQRVRIW
ncbi:MULTISPECIES: M13 family metallopeptidase [Asticcacaulis]|uniref:M13 family metallopeptidase n=1 Tax=Asticcacaulis TaxID=76890 RepID=UPI001AE16CAD|nr:MULTISPECIES: M13 family metallopeptidase [Asticcacaulis]MBP2160397.1 endothelin-converting enzyme/putative endopeptidase [Asticcacaulis solisilvae]MDR6801300.1 endothelin-converting enzyme/putative endopeptidase [Asticcacaulis sp. BE141]